MMELLQRTSPLIDLYGALKTPSRFSLVDVGCSGGIDKTFLRLGDKLRALGIDASVEEIKNLKSRASKSIQYVDGLVGLPPEHPFLTKMGSSFYIHNVPWERLTVTETLYEIRKKKHMYTGHTDKMADNLWLELELSKNRVILSDLMVERGFSDTDMLKIDIDGADFMALQSMDGRFEEFGVITVVMEVNYFGSDIPEDHTFHNTDRFMRKNGFDLFGLTVRPYSMKALPSCYQWEIPAQTVIGRPVQGDALYFRDICRSFDSVPEKFKTPEKLINTVLLYSLFGLPDCAAEIIKVFDAALSPYIDSALWLNKLTKQLIDLQDGLPKNISTYDELIERFNNDSEDFYFAVNELNYRKRYFDLLTQLGSTKPEKNLLQRAIRKINRMLGRLQE